MCNTCLVKAYEICELFPGWFLVRATKDVVDDDEIEWHAGELGLLRMNDPDIIFDFEPIKDPTFYMSPEEEEKYYEYHSEEANKIDQKILDMADRDILLDPVTGYELITSAKEAGFKFGEYNFAFWLF